MNEIQINNFDYSLLSSDEKLATLENEKRLDEVFERYQPEVGEILYDQQQVLANHTDGTFQMWYESKGFNRGQVYRYINKHKYVLTNCEDPEKIDVFNNAPKSLQNEMSKPSADPEINKKVFDGDITTHKEYKEAERKRKEAEQRAKEAERTAKEYESQLKLAYQENDVLANKLETAENREPKTIEKYYEPEDYQSIKDSLQRMEEINEGREKHVEKLQKEIADMREKRSDMDKKSKEYDRLNQAINEMNGRLDKGQKRIAAQKEVYDLVRNANRLIEEVAPLSYLVNTEEILDNEYATKPIKKVIKDLSDITKRLNESINQKEILEVN